MPYIIVAVIGFLGFFALIKSSGVLIATAKRSVGLLDVLLSPLSEEEKLELAPAKTAKLMSALMGSLGLFALIGLASWGLWGIAGISESGLSSAEAIVCYSVGASLPFFIPSKNSSAYSKGAQLLHQLLLDNYHLHRKLFRRDVKKYGVKRREDFMIVTGLARAGTTSMLNHMVKLGGLSSLNYANMPLVLAPKSWAKVYKPKSGETKERSHGDGIKIGLDSNEALEEFFFKAVTNDSFIKKDVLVEHELSEDQYSEYLDYQSVVRSSDEDMYIAKNNNFLLRYATLRKHNEKFTAVIMFRHPLYHAKSLMSKHREFTKMQEDDVFMLEYMNWLGHHEFGLNHKQFDFSGNGATSGDTEELDYWLQVWINYYSKAVQIEDESTVWVAYDAFCERPSEVVKAICTKAGHQCNVPEITSHSNSRAVKDAYNEELLAEAMAIYEKLAARSL